MLEVIEEPKVQIDPNLMHELASQVHEIGQVVLHFLYKSPPHGFMNIRIWPTSYLYDQHSHHRSELVHVEHIALAPQWMTCLPMEKIYFTLIFSGLPKHCTVFDFLEHCENEAGAFAAYGIERNETDVYYLEIS